jgi:hypothetical protein
VDELKMSIGDEGYQTHNPESILKSGMSPKSFVHECIEEWQPVDELVVRWILHRERRYDFISNSILEIKTATQFNQSPRQGR